MANLRIVSGGGVGAASLGPSLLARGEDGLLAELYQRYAPAVFGRCRYLLKDDDAAKDALQEVFTKVLLALPGFRASASPITWLTHIATNHCLNVIRARRPMWREQLIRLAPDRHHPGVEPDRRELLRALLSVAEPEAQEIAVLYYVDELTQTEIADLVGRSLPTVRKRLREFLAAARAALAEALPGIELPEGDDL